MKKYKLQEIIGDGTYGTVWKSIHIETGELVAIKKLKNKIKSWQECIEMKEVKALSKLKSHPNIIKLKEIIRETNSEVFMIFEFAELNLFQYTEKIKKRGETIPERKIKEIIYQITSGIQFTHQNGYFHRDLKPENILMMKGDQSTGEDYIKIADFGLARELPYYNCGPLTDYVCTRWYRAPECVLRSTNYSSAMDVWAIGCVMAELYMLAPLFPGASEIDQLAKVTNILGIPKLNDWPEGFKLIQKTGQKFPNSNGVSLSSIIPKAGPEAINLLSEILIWDGVSRPNCAKILANSYFDDIRSNSQSKYSPVNSIYNTSTNHINSFTNTNKNFFNKNLVNNNNQIQNNNSSIGSIVNNAFQNTQKKQNSNITYNNPSNTNNPNLTYNNNPYVKTENYCNNFNYKNYRSNNNYIPDVTSYNANLNNLFFSNFNSNNSTIIGKVGTNLSNLNNTNNGNNGNNPQRSKLSSLAEHDLNLNLNFNKYNNKLSNNNKNYAINNIFDQIIQASGNSNLRENQENPFNNNYNITSSKNSNNFSNMDYLSFNKTREKENLMNINSNQTTFYQY